MSQPILEGRPPSEEEKHLRAWFLEMETAQIDFLDQAAKRLIELITGLLGVLFAVTAFGKDFPPPYLKDNGGAQVAVAATLVCYAAGLLWALWAVQPRSYKYYAHNLTEMKAEREKILTYKASRLVWAGWAFYAGSVALGCLILFVVFGS